MRLYEFEAVDPLIPKLVAVSDQLISDFSDDELQSGMSVDDLLTYFQKYDIVLDKMDLFNMIKKPPLKNIIDNIQNDKVVFKGSEDQAMPDKDDNKEVVAAMAAKAAKTHSK